jgi:hypothetical protein
VLTLYPCEKQVKQQLRARFDSEMTSMHANSSLLRKGPRHPDCNSGQVMMATYLSFVRARDLSRTPQHLKCGRLSFAEVQTLCRYRLGWHDLQVQKGRYGGVAREQRVCRVCANTPHAAQQHARPVEDLLHFLLECPALQHVRDRYPHLFVPQYISDPDAAVHARYIINHTNQQQVAEVLQALRAAREQVLSGGQPPAAPSPTTVVLARWSAWLRYRAMVRNSPHPIHDWY